MCWARFPLTYWPIKMQFRTFVWKGTKTAGEPNNVLFLVIGLDQSEQVLKYFPFTFWKGFFGRTHYRLNNFNIYTLLSARIIVTVILCFAATNLNNMNNYAAHCSGWMPWRSHQLCTRDVYLTLCNASDTFWGTKAMPEPLSELKASLTISTYWDFSCTCSFMVEWQPTKAK